MAPARGSEVRRYHYCCFSSSCTCFDKRPLTPSSDYEWKEGQSEEDGQNLRRGGKIIGSRTLQGHYEMQEGMMKTSP